MQKASTYWKDKKIRPVDSSKSPLTSQLKILIPSYAFAIKQLANMIVLAVIHPQEQMISYLDTGIRLNMGCLLPCIFDAS